MTVATAVVTDPVEVEHELSRLCGLGVDDLKQALLGGVLGRATCTENDPIYFPGSTMHAVTTRALREQLLPRGWTKIDTGGYSRTVSPDGSIALVVATGDGRTGLHDPMLSHLQPKTTRAKGPLTRAVVEANERQLELGGMVPIRALTSVAQTWIFLVHYAGGEAGAMAELSLPSALDAEGCIAVWRKRIVVGSTDNIDPNTGMRGVPERGPDFDVEIIPRVA